MLKLLNAQAHVTAPAPALACFANQTLGCQFAYVLVKRQVIFLPTKREIMSTVNLGLARIKTTIAITTEDVEEGIQALMSNSKNHKRLIGLDTMSSGMRNSSIVALQLCDDSQCLIVRLLFFSSYSEILPSSLYNFLSLPGFTFVGFGIKDALASLRQEYGFICKNALEAGHSGSRELICPVKYVLRTMYIPPTHCISDTWNYRSSLTENLIKLAVSNAHAAFRIGDIIY